MNKKRIVLIVLLGLILLIAVQYIVSESRKKNVAAAFGLEYVREHYQDQSELKVTGKCHPPLENGMHKIAIEAPTGDTYYLYVMLNRHDSLVWIDDATEDVRSGQSRFRCGKN